MEKLTILRGAAAPLFIDNINTDQIAPVQFMRALRAGLSDSAVRALAL